MMSKIIKLNISLERNGNLCDSYDMYYKTVRSAQSLGVIEGIKAMSTHLNIYAPHDGGPPPKDIPVVFISHRSSDKSLARALARLFSELGLHYWLDENDNDVSRAARLGMTGDNALVHAIERGLRHSTWLLGALTPRTAGSWWVPYEIGFARAQQKRAVGIAPNGRLIPEYAAIYPVYGSVDEIVRWADSVRGDHLHKDLSGLDPQVLIDLAAQLPTLPDSPTPSDLCSSALRAIELLAQPEVHSELALRSSTFSWMPAVGDAIKTFAYLLLAPLALRLVAAPMTESERKVLDISADVLTQHYALAAEAPSLEYSPESVNWRVCRYQTPAKSWMQGLRPDQLSERLERFLLTKTHKNELRLATMAEFAAEYDRVRKLGDFDQRSLGVLMNPPFGFNFAERPVYWRVLVAQAIAYSNLLGQALPTSIDGPTRQVVERFLTRRTIA
jgi:TIR domain